MRRHLIPTSAGHVHARSAGPDASPTVVLVHQSPSSGRMWLDVMAQVADDVHTVAVDLLGYGESDHPGEQLTLEQHADALAECLGTVAPGPLVLFGHHTGAAYAARLAHILADRVVGLVLSGYPSYPDWRTKLARLGPVLHPAHVGPDGEELLGIWRYVTGPLEHEPDPNVALTIMTDRLRAGRVWFTAYAQLLAADLDRVLREARDDARPTVVLAADRDPLTPFAGATAEVLGVGVTQIEGTSWVSYEHPDRVAAVVHDVVGRVRDGARP